MITAEMKKGAFPTIVEHYDFGAGDMSRYSNSTIPVDVEDADDLGISATHYVQQDLEKPIKFAQKAARITLNGSLQEMCDSESAIAYNIDVNLMLHGLLELNGVPEENLRDLFEMFAASGAVYEIVKSEIVEECGDLICDNESGPNDFVILSCYYSLIKRKEGEWFYAKVRQHPGFVFEPFIKSGERRLNMKSLAEERTSK